MKTMNRLTIGRACDLIKRDLGLSAAALVAPSDMDGNFSYPWYEMTSGNQHIEVTTDDIRQGKYTDKIITLRVTHENSSRETTEYFYSDTLEYAAIYTDWKNRETICETMEKPEDDPTLRRLKKEALDDSWKHFHVPIRQEERVSQHDTEISTSPTEETSAHDSFQGKLKIRISDLHGTFIHDTDPFDETKLNWCGST